MALRDSQDITLGVEKPAVSKIRDSQDITLAVESIVAHLRDSQDVLLAIFKPQAVSLLTVFDDDTGQFPGDFKYNLASVVNDPDMISKKKFVQPQVCVIS